MRGIPKFFFDTFDKLLRFCFAAYFFNVQIKRDFSITISVRQSFCIVCITFSFPKLLYHIPAGFL